MSAATDVRKVVTVLFCDLAGYTSTGDGLDPEALRTLQSRYFEDARAALERHGGTVEKFIGDAVMAVFGIPRLHEDDALRALRAAVELRDAVAELGFLARIGVNTGEVVAGTGDALVTGDAVNVAARLEQAAEPGEILLGEATLALARDAVEVEVVEPIAAKGKPEPVTAHRLLRVVEGAPAFERRLDAPLVGRRQELARVRSAFDAALAERAPRLVTVFGPPGIGKTRLAREVAASLGGEADVLVGRCLPYGEGITYWPLAEIYRQARADEEWGAAQAAGSPEDVAWEVRKWLEARARAHPQTLVFEDIHWAEPPLLDLIEHVAEWSRDAPMLVFCLARPDLRDERAAWSGEAITLEPLTGDESDELIESLLGDAELDDATRSRVRDVAEGNPLFVEQLLAMMAVGAPPDEVPVTIQALLAARLDALPDDERQIIERASVVGLDFEWEALGELDPDGRRPPGGRLAALVRKELIRPHEAIDDTFRFRHILIRDAAYDRIPKSQRADLHERFAGWLDGRGEEFEEIVGYHLEQAYLYGVELGNADDGLGGRAAACLAAAGERAFARDDMSAAANLLERAIALPGVQERVDLRLRLASALLDIGRTRDAEVTAQKARADARANGDRAGEFRAVLFRGQITAWTEPDPTLLPLAQEALALFQDAGDDLGAMSAWRAIALEALERGRRAEAAEAFEQAIVCAHRAGDMEERELLGWLEYALLHGPMPVREILRWVDETSRPPEELEPIMFASRAVLVAMDGRVNEARALLARGEPLVRELVPAWQAPYTEFAWHVETISGDQVAAERWAGEGRALYEELDQRLGVAVLAGMLAQTLCAQGRYHEAERWTDLAESSYAGQATGFGFNWQQARAKVLAWRGQLQAAERVARDAFALHEQTDMLGWQAEALLDLAEVLTLTGKRDEAIAATARAAELYERKGIVLLLERTHARLAELQAQPPATA